MEFQQEDDQAINKRKSNTIAISINKLEGKFKLIFHLVSCVCFLNLESS